MTNSKIDRQNILNNSYALHEIEKAIHIKGVLFDGSYRFTKEQLSNFFEVDTRTIERILEQNGDGISKNGYEVLRGKRLKSLILELKEQDVTDINVGNKTPQLGVFDFRAFLNMGMLLTESERSKLLRQAILDILIDIINQKNRWINEVY